MREPRHDLTPLHWAAFEGQTSVVEALLAAGAAPDARNEKGQTPFDVISPKQKGTDLYWELHDAQYH